MFYVAFDAFYYSWSPHVAQLILEQPVLKPPLRLLLYPLVGSLLVFSYVAQPMAQLSSEIAVYVAGIVAALLLGFAYITPPAYIAARMLKKRIELKSIKLVLASFTIVILFCGLFQAAGLHQVLIVTTPVLIISAMLIPPLTLTYKISNIRSRSAHNKSSQ